jgi:tetratricopeptide (TPR) repeat protein
MDRVAEPRLPAVELSAGTKIGHYVIEQRLGAGGMGVVYAARDTDLARGVALKIVRPRVEVDAMEARLHREGMAMARLSHRNVVPVFELGNHDGQLYIAMELVDGETLRSWVTTPRPWRNVAQLFAKAGRGLEAAHAAGVLHRDFKPDNVMVGQGEEPRITDFGLARELAMGSVPPSFPTPDSDGGLSLVTATGSLAGTPAYMAPEQLLRQPSGPKADQFSFCVSLFEVLYGVRPFRATTPKIEALIDEIRAGRIAKPTATRGVPRWLHAAIVRGLAFDPDRRWPSMLALIGRLERGVRRRRIGISLVFLGLAIVIAVGLNSQRSTSRSCVDVAPRGNDAVTVLVCREEYARTSLPQTGALLAEALRRSGSLKEASTLASELLATSVRGDALYTLGKVASDDHNVAEAEPSLRLALELHREQHNWGAAAQDLLALAGVSNDFLDQLVDLDEAVIDAQRGGKPRIEASSHIAAARVLSEMGARTGALYELARSEPLVTQPSERVRLNYERGNVLQNLEDNALAAEAFQRAIDGADAVTSARFALWASLNRTYSLAESGRLVDAAAELKNARQLDPRGRKLVDRLSLEARIAAHEGDLTRAAELIERAIAAPRLDTTGDLVEYEVQRAEVALQRGELDAAERGARRAIAQLEKLRSVHPPVELRSWMITDRRMPYEILFASLAGRGDASGALVVFDQVRGLGVLAGLARGDDGTSRTEPRSPVWEAPAGSTSSGAYPVGDLARLFPLLATSSLATSRSERAILEAARSSSLLVLVVARGELWRITAAGGRLQVGRIGTLSALRPQLDRFRLTPADRVAAAELGNLLVPAELAGSSDQILHVVLDESLAWLPVGELRIGERRLISARPIVLPARASDAGCTAAAARGPRQVVMLGASSELARRVSAVTSDATRAALFGVARGDVLHLAVPTDRDALGDALVFRDGRVRALEIAGHGSAAAQVVLAVPDAGPAGTAALAMAFLAAGADQVIATVRPVSRAATDRLVDRLYRSDLSDLARALARIQAGGTAANTPDASADDDEHIGLGFAAFGRATCNQSP